MSGLWERPARVEGWIAVECGATYVHAPHLVEPYQGDDMPTEVWCRGILSAAAIAADRATDAGLRERVAALADEWEHDNVRVVRALAVILRAAIDADPSGGE